MIKELIETHILECQAKREKFKELKIDGPWMNEPDYQQWKHKDIDCLIVRNPEMFSLCGYVGVKPGHPYYEKGYDDVDLPAHGGLTYSAHCKGKICHITEDPNDKTWWLGFDCAHAWDVMPGMLILRETVPGLKRIDDEYRPKMIAMPDELQEHYRTFNWVKAECENLAEIAAKKNR